MTVLTSVKNGVAHIAETIESVQGQTLQDWEYLIIDDASDDETTSVVEPYCAKDPRIRLIRCDSSGGPYVAANTGLSEALGTYVARIDADDIAFPRRLERQVAYLSSDVELEACASWWTLVGGGAQRSQMFPTTSPRNFCWAACVASGLVHSTAMVTKRSLDDMGGYEGLPVAADYGMWLWLSRRRSVGVIPETLVSWRRHSGQVSATSLDEQMRTSGALLQRHLCALTDEDWTLEEADALWRAGRWHSVDLREGSAALDRWESHWRRDALLRPQERRELGWVAARVRARLIKWNHRWDFASVASSLLSWAGVRLRT